VLVSFFVFPLSKIYIAHAASPTWFWVLHWFLLPAGIYNEIYFLIDPLKNYTVPLLSCSNVRYKASFSISSSGRRRIDNTNPAHLSSVATLGTIEQIEESLPLLWIAVTSRLKLYIPLKELSTLVAFCAVLFLFDRHPSISVFIP